MTSLVQRVLGILGLAQILLISEPPKWMWSGALTPTSLVIVAKPREPGANAKVFLSENGGIWKDSRAAGQETASGVLRFQLTGLTPGTSYRYAVTSGSIPQAGPEGTGSFRTPSEGAQSFSWVLGACAANSDNHVYRRMVEKNYLFYLNTGDLHYANPVTPDGSAHRRGYEDQVLGKEAARAVFLKTPLAYTWDDHDYAGNDSDGDSPGMPGARKAFGEMVPHYPLALAAGSESASVIRTDLPICQSFVIGRVRFILIDSRSERKNERVLQESQLAWFKREILAAKNSRQLAALVTSYSWNGDRKDNWGGFPEQRREISDFFRTEAVTNLMILSGDAHMLAVDDGENADFGSEKSPYRYPIFQSAAIWNRGSSKGGTFNIMAPRTNPSQKVTTNAAGDVIRESFGQYALMHFADDGGPEVAVRFEGFRVDLEGREERLMDWSFKRRL